MPVLTMSRGWGLGRALGAVAVLAAACSDASMAAVGLAAERTAGPEAPSGGQRGPTIDRSELRPHAIGVRGSYYVRMGAFDELEAARELATELRRIATEPVEVVEYGIGDGRHAVRLYRVLIGPAASRGGVVELVEALKGMGYGTSGTARSFAAATEPRAAPKIASVQRDVDSDRAEPVGNEPEVTPTVTGRPQAPAPAKEVPRPTVGEALSSGDPEEDLASSGGTDAARSPGDVMGDPERLQVVAYEPERRVKAFLVSEDGQRFLQMAAYAVRSTAEILASQLRLVTAQPVFVSEAVNNDGKSLYRVRIGPVGSDASLAVLVDALRPNYGSGWVLPSTSSTRSAPSTRSTSPTRTRTTRTAWVVYGDSERFVQVGAYSARSSAEAIASELSPRIDGAVRVTEIAGDSGDPVYRVRIGPVLEDDSLMALVAALESLGYVVD